MDDQLIQDDDYTVDSAGTRYYRPRPPAAQAPSSTDRPVKTSSGDQPTAQAPGSFDASRLYQPRYMEENPNNFGSRLAGSTRPGTLLNIIGQMTGGANYEGAHNYNAAEHRKFQDSLEVERLRQSDMRWGAYQKSQERPARVPSRLAIAESLQNGDFDDDPDLKQALISGLAGGRAKPTAVVSATTPTPKELVPYEYGTPRHEGEDDASYRSRVFQNWQTDRNKREAAKHPPKAAPQPKPPKPPAAPKQPMSAQNYGAKLAQDMIKANQGAPLTEEQQQQLKQSVGQYARQAGLMPDQRAAVPGGAPQQPPKLKPNWRYRINGKEVQTDASGQVVQ